MASGDTGGSRVALAGSSARVSWSRRPITWLLAIVLMTVAAYAQALRLSFVGDDFIILHVVRQAGGLRDLATYFRIDFFGYYRPVAFLSHALDWRLWGEQPLGFHLTSLVLHGANAALVFSIGRKLFSPFAAGAAALLFALHPSNHEAVFWVSSRFDLLATFFVLLATLALVGHGDSAAEPSNGRRLLVAACFALALLSKESVLAFPLIALAYEIFIRRASLRGALRTAALLLAVVGGYVVVRASTAAPDVSRSMGRPGKALLLGASLVVVAAIPLVGRARCLRALLAWRTRVALVVALALAVACLGAFVPATRTVVAPKLAFASFAGFYLLSPVITFGRSVPLAFDPSQPIWSILGCLFLASAAAFALFSWRATGRRRLFGFATPNAQLAFVLVLLVAALLPVSSMTEGKRYLYLASIGMTWLAAWLVDQSHKATKTIATIAVALVLALSAWQLQLKAADWSWASEMTTAAVRLVRAGEAKPCGARDVLLLTAPVNVRDVYCNFYNYTFEDAVTGCHPELVRALVRVVGQDVETSARWEGPGLIALDVRGAADRLVTSADLRHFDTPLSAVSAPLATDAGVVSVAHTPDGTKIELKLSPTLDLRNWRVLYYGSGEVRELPMPAPSRIPYTE